MTDQKPDAPTRTPATASAPKKRPWGKIILFLSLALNLLIVGVVAGAILGGPRGHGGNPLLRDLGFGPFVQALPRADKHALTESLKREAGTFRENRAALRRQFEAFLAALQADPFDPAEIKRLIVEQRGRVSDRQSLGQELLLERLTGMNAVERATYAEKLNNLMRRRKP